MALQFIEYEGELWKVLGVGVERGDTIYLHIGRTTGFRAKQVARFIPKSVYMAGVPFDEEAFGTTNPEWTKERVSKGGNSLDRLAAHIVSRTPPRSFGDVNSLFTNLVRRNQKALGTWSAGYEALHARVRDLLLWRDEQL